MIRALIFDFDGLILDTEIAIFRCWEEVYGQHGQTLDLQTYAACIGTAENVFDPHQHLESLIGRTLDRQAMTAQRYQRYWDFLDDRPLPGVEEYLREAKRLGLATAIASSSEVEWVHGHLDRLGLRSYFDVIRCGDQVKRTKPDPELYRTAAEQLGVAPAEAIAFEDSPNGVLAARRAGLYCVAVPNRLTRELDLSAADLIIDSLAAMPLSELLASR